MIKIRSCVRLICPLLLAACGSGPGGGEWGGTITDSAGVAIVGNPERGLWAGDEGWTVVEELRIGAAEGEPEYQFGAITGIDVDARGRIYVLDQQARNIRVFDAGGAYLRTIGRAGTGPGEFGRGVSAVLVGPGDTLYVPDMSQQRVSRFLPDGTAAGSFSVDLKDGIPARWEMMPDGRFAQEVRPMPMPNQATGSQVHAVLIRETGGAIVDTLLHLPRGESVSFQGGAPRFRMFEPEPVWALDAEARAYSGVNTDYRIEVRSPDGRLVRIITRPFERLPVTEADRQAFRAAFEEMFERQGVPPAAAQQVLSNLSFADEYPAFATIAAGPEGTLWVQHIQSAERVAAGGGSFDAADVGAPEWDVFDRDGRFLGVVAFPERFRPIRFRGEEVYGVWRDELDVQHVLRLRIIRPAAG